MSKTILLSEDTMNAVGNAMAVTPDRFNCNVRYFLHQLLDDPVHAKVPTCIRMAGISRSRFIKMLVDRGIITRTERLNDTDKDGNRKTPTMSVKYTVVGKVPDEMEYRIPKSDFDRKVEKLRRSIFEKNLPDKKEEKKFNTAFGDQLSLAKNSPLTMGFIAPVNDSSSAAILANHAAEALNGRLQEEGEGGATSADASGQFSQPIFGMIRRKIEEAINSDSRYRDLGGGFDVPLENGSVIQSLVTIQNKQTNTLYHICFDGANFNIYRDMQDGEPCSHVSYVFDKLLDAFDNNGYTNMNESVDELQAKHSSNASFDHFDSSFMGKGCGSQVYGWGHYVTTSGEVARGYKRHFKANPGYIDGGMKKGSYTYTVEIPDDNGRNYLLWDGKPLPNLMFANECETFGQQYEKLAYQSSPKEVSLELADMGYIGIKIQPYRNSRKLEDKDAFKKGANYVIFRDNDIHIINKKQYTQNVPKVGRYHLVGAPENKGHKNFYDSVTGKYLFGTEDQNTWPYIFPTASKGFYAIDYGNAVNIINMRSLNFLYPIADKDKWPRKMTIPPVSNPGYYLASTGPWTMAFKSYTTQNLFGDKNNPRTWSWKDYINRDGVAELQVRNGDENYSNIYISADGKAYDEKYNALSAFGKLRHHLSKPLIGGQVNESNTQTGKVFKISEEQRNAIMEVTATSTVGGPNTDYQYTVPFAGDEETLARHDGDGGSVSINHIDESNKESLHTSNVGDYINDNPIAIHPEDPTMKRGEGKHGSHGIERIEEGKKYVNMNVELRKGGRNAVKMSVEDFKNEMIHAYHEYAMEEGGKYDYDLKLTPSPGHFVYSLCYGNKKNKSSKFADALYDDIWQGKYKFDTENVEDRGGIKMSNKGFPYIQCDAGGDWECPVCFFVYFDGNKFRGYVPLKGNALNRNQKHAFSGSGNEDDAKFIQKELGLEYEEAESLCDDIGYNTDACLEDFLSRVEVKGLYKKHDYTKDEEKFKEYRNIKIKEQKQRHEEAERQREANERLKNEGGNNAVDLNEETDFLKKHGIEEVSVGLGFSEDEQKWYGWSHRAICGFGVGDKFRECYPNETKTGKEIKTLEQAKEAAKKFADSVS